MWNNYYDSITYIEKEDKLDRTGNIIYKSPKSISARFIGGGEKFITNGEGNSTKYTREYHIPFMIKEGDKIDGRLVVHVQPSRDVFGNFHFCIAKVE